MQRLSFALLLALLAACSGPAPARAPTNVVPMMWDFHPEGASWTAASFAMLEGPAAGLAAFVPSDIEAWCPAYPAADARGRAAFWTGLLSALAEHESTWNPAAVGGGGRWFGLVQISPATARFYGCEATTGAALQDGPANLQCALQIWSVTVPRDGVVSAGRGGVAADWGPFVVASKREEMRSWVSSQPYCAP